MLTTELPLTFSMVWTIAIANIVVAILLMLFTTQIAKVAFVPGHLIVPGVILFVFMGAWLGGSTMGDWVSCFAFGIIGFVMKRGGWPRPPLILALILGAILERSFHLSVRAHDGYGWLTRPIVLIVLVLIALTLYFAATALVRTKRSGSAPTAGEGAERDPIFSAPFSLALLVVFVGAGVMALQWPHDVRQFPLLASVPGAALTFWILTADMRQLRLAAAEAGGFAAAARTAAAGALLGPASIFFIYLLAMILIALLIGQKLAIPIFIFAYLMRWGRYGWRLSIGYALAGWVMLVGFYDKTLHLFWHPSLLQQWIPGDQSYLLPLWLFI